MKIINNLYRIDTPLTQASNAAGKSATTDAGGDGRAIRLSELSTQLHKLELNSAANLDLTQPVSSRSRQP